MSELQPILTRLVAAGALMATLVGVLVQFWIKPWINKKYSEKWWSDLATNGAAFVLSLIATTLVYILLGPAVTVLNLIVEIVLVAFIAAAISTLGYEVFKNVSYRNITNISGDSITTGDITESKGVAIGEDSSADSS